MPLFHVSGCCYAVVGFLSGEATIIARDPDAQSLLAAGTTHAFLVKAVVAAVPGEQVDAEKLIEYCRERLAHDKCPRTVDVREALPRNETGKILKRKAREGTAGGSDAAGPPRRSARQA